MLLFAIIALIILQLNSMEITKLSSQGQVIIPQSLRDAHHWENGQEFLIIEMDDGIFLKPKKPFPETKIEDVAGCLKYQGEPKTLEDIEDAIRRGVEELWNDRS
jgi:AbrB family looped-hinge helix DNA binding protein